MIQRVYLDTSVIGGLLDEEFQVATSRLFNDFLNKRFHPVLSDLTIDEVRKAPKEVQDLLNHEALKNANCLEIDLESIELAEKYLSSKVVPPHCEVDARHIALATVLKVDILVSWNFKHIVKMSRIQGYNAVNLMNGYKMLEIRSPLEVYYEED